MCLGCAAQMCPVCIICCGMYGWAQLPPSSAWYGTQPPAPTCTSLTSYPLPPLTPCLPLTLPSHRARARMSQTDPNVQPAEVVADQVAAVINASALGRTAPAGGVLGIFGRVYQALFNALCPAAGRRVAPAAGGAAAAAPVWQPRPPPNWFLAGGAARYYFLLGLAQKLLPGGWPTNPAMAKRFGLDQLLGA